VDKLIVTVAWLFPSVTVMGLPMVTVGIELDVKVLLTQVASYQAA
jgi:hypothetical protein